LFKEGEIRLPKVYSIQKNLLSASLSPELFQEHRVRHMVIRSGDTVSILRGSFRDVEGKVSKVNRQKGYVFIEGVTREKSDGSTRQIPIHSSKVVIRRIVLDDKRRKAIMQRRTEVKPEPKTEEKPKSRQRGKGAKTSKAKTTKRKVAKEEL
jgi:large subunit ribosomal protein L26e